VLALTETLGCSSPNSLERHSSSRPDDAGGRRNGDELDDSRVSGCASSKGTRDGSCLP
jgi:hypothetical protein